MKRCLLIIGLALLAWNLSFAQEKGRTVVALGDYRTQLLDGDGARLQTLQLDSQLMHRKMLFSVLVPSSYNNKGESGRVFPVLYLLHGLAGHFENWNAKTAIDSYTASSNVIVVMPEGGDGWYTDSSTVPNDKYESYILDELIPAIDHRYRTIAEKRGRSIAGLSMGGYGAIKFGVKYPDRFSLIGSFSGALDAPLRGQNSAFLRPSILSVFGPDESKTRKDNDIYALIREMPADRLKQLPYIYFDCGTEDSFFPINRDFDTLLLERKIPHEFRELPGKHEWPYWDAQVQEFLRVAKTHGAF